MCKQRIFIGGKECFVNVIKDVDVVTSVDARVLSSYNSGYKPTRNESQKLRDYIKVWLLEEKVLRVRVALVNYLEYSDYYTFDNGEHMPYFVARKVSDFYEDNSEEGTALINGVLKGQKISKELMLRMNISPLDLIHNADLVVHLYAPGLNGVNIIDEYINMRSGTRLQAVEDIFSLNEGIFFDRVKEKFVFVPFISQKGSIYRESNPRPFVTVYLPHFYRGYDFSNDKDVNTTMSTYSWTLFLAWVFGLSDEFMKILNSTGYYHINHINGNQFYANYKNLEVCTPQENRLHARYFKSLQYYMPEVTRYLMTQRNKGKETRLCEVLEQYAISAYDLMKILDIIREDSPELLYDVDSEILDSNSGIFKIFSLELLTEVLRLKNTI